MRFEAFNTRVAPEQAQEISLRRVCLPSYCPPIAPLGVLGLKSELSRCHLSEPWKMIMTEQCVLMVRNRPPWRQ